MTNPEAALRAFHNRLTEPARIDRHEDKLIQAWEVALDEKRALTPAREANPFYEEAPVKFKSRHIKTLRASNEDVTNGEIKAAVRVTVKNKSSTMVEVSLDDNLRTLFQNAQNVIRSAVYSVVEQGIRDVLYKDVIWETMERNLAKFFDTDAAVDGSGRDC